MLNFPKIQTLEGMKQLKKEILEALEFYEKYFDKSHLFLDQEAYEIYVKTLDENKKLKEKADLSSVLEKKIGETLADLHIANDDIIKLESKVKELEEKLENQIAWNIGAQMNIITARNAKEKFRKNKEIVEKVREYADSVSVHSLSHKAVADKLKKILGEENEN